MCGTAKHTSITCFELVCTIICVPTVALHLFIITIYFMLLFQAIALYMYLRFYERVRVRAAAKHAATPLTICHYADVPSTLH